jgi:hypothetical protein
MLNISYFCLPVACVGIDTGAILIDSSTVTVDRVSFVSNSLSKISGFPNLRHNIFVSNHSAVSIISMIVDTESSNFVYVSDDNTGSVVSGLEV